MTRWAGDIVHRPSGRPHGSGTRSAERARPETLVTLDLKAPRVSHWLQELGTRWRAEVEVRVCRPSGNGRGTLLQLLEITASAGSMPDIVRFLREHAGTRRVSVSTLAPPRLLVRLTQRLPALCRSVFEMGAICATCPFLPPDPSRSDTSPGEETSWSLLVPGDPPVANVLQSLERAGAALPPLVRVGRYHARDVLTPRQEHALSLAVRLGYYEVPRRARLADVAHGLGVSRAAAMEILRRATRKLAVQQGPDFLPGTRRPPSGIGRPAH